MLDLETGDGMKIRGLDAFQKTLDDAQHAISSLDGQIGSVQFDPSDARSVEDAVALMESMIDSKLSSFRGNAIVESLIPQMKENKAAILERAKRERAAPRR
jgi:hypothetical protein